MNGSNDGFAPRQIDKTCEPSFAKDDIVVISGIERLEVHASAKGFSPTGEDRDSQIGVFLNLPDCVTQPGGQAKVDGIALIGSVQPD